MDLQRIKRKLLAQVVVDDVEAEGCDEGRFFVHLKAGHSWTDDPHWVYDPRSCRTFGSLNEALWALKTDVVKL